MTKTERLVGQALEIETIRTRLTEIRRAMANETFAGIAVSDACADLGQALDRLRGKIGESVFDEALAASKKSDG